MKDTNVPPMVHNELNVLSKLFSSVLKPLTKSCHVIISNDITMPATIQRKQQQAAKLSTVILTANINSKAQY